MNWSNNRGNNWGNSNNYGRNQGFSNRGFNRPQKKRSGAKSGTDKNGNPYISGWKYDKTNGLRSFFASPYSGTKETKSKSGKIWENWFVQIRVPSGEVIKTSGLFDKMNNKLIVPQLGFVLNPRGGAGGYCGPYYYKKNR